MSWQSSYDKDIAGHYMYRLAFFFILVTVKSIEMFSFMNTFNNKFCQHVFIVNTCTNMFFITNIFTNSFSGITIFS